MYSTSSSSGIDGGVSNSTNASSMLTSPGLDTSQCLPLPSGAGVTGGSPPFAVPPDILGFLKLVLARLGRTTVSGASTLLNWNGALSGESNVGEPGIVEFMKGVLFVVSSRRGILVVFFVAVPRRLVSLNMLKPGVPVVGVRVHRDTENRVTYWQQSS